MILFGRRDETDKIVSAGNIAREGGACPIIGSGCGLERLGGNTESVERWITCSSPSINGCRTTLRLIR